MDNKKTQWKSRWKWDCFIFKDVSFKFSLYHFESCMVNTGPAVEEVGDL